MEILKNSFLLVGVEESVAEGFDALKSVSVKVGSAGTDCEFWEEGEGGLDKTRLILGRKRRSIS